MLFRDVKQGYPVYIFNRKDVSMTIGKVTNAPMSHFDQKFPTDPKFSAGKMVVDLNVDVDGKVISYVFDDTAEVGYTGDLVISANKDAVLREIERVKSQSGEALKMVDYHKAAIEKCDELLKEYSQEYRERTENSERMSALEGKVDKLTDSLAELIGKLKKGGEE